MIICRDRETDRSAWFAQSESSLQQEALLCGFRMVLFCLVVPIWMHFLCAPRVLECSLATQAAGDRVSALPSLANHSSLVVWTGFYWVFNIYMQVYINTISKLLEPCKQNLPFPFLESKAGREKLLLNGPRSISGAQISGLAAARVQFDPER